jgi:hypothetical protein
MVTRAIRIAAIALALFAGSSGVVAAQDSYSGFVALTGGVTGDDRAGGVVGGEAGFDFPVPLSIVVEGGRMFKIGSPDLTARADRIAGAVGVSASAVDRVTYFDAGLRYRLPALGATRPFVTVGGGIARVTTETSFSANGTAVSPSTLAVQLGADLTGEVTKPFVMAGGGVSWTVAHVLVEASYRYGRILPKTESIPNDTAINTHRVQASIGVRF